MILWIGFAVALLAFAGWGATLVMFTRALLPMASALKILHAVDAAIDDRIHRVVEQIRNRDRRTPPQPQSKPGPSNETIAQDLSAIFGGGPLFEPVPEQPEDDMEEVRV